MPLPAAEPKSGDADVILIVDDEPEVAAAIVEALDGHGHRIVVAHSGKEARRQLSEQSVALMLLDLRLPDVEGLQFLREIRERPLPPDVVVVTGYASLESALEAMEAGAGGYVEKPLDWIRLRRVVARSLERRRLVRENAALVAQLEARRRRLAVLNEVSRRLAEVHETDQILALIVEEAKTLLDVEAAGLRLLEGSELVLVASAGEGASVLMARQRLRVGESLTGAVVAAGEPIVVEDLTEDVRFDPTHKQGAVELGFHGWLGVPLHAHGRITGTLAVYARRRRHFDPDEVGLLSAFADQASLAIEKGQLLAEAENQRRRLSEIFDSTSDGMVLVGRDGQIVSANRRAGELFRFDPARPAGLGLTGMLARNFPNEMDYHAAVEPLLAVLDGEGQGEGDLEMPLAGLTLHWMARPAGGLAEPSAVTFTFGDVTQEREVGRMKSDFVSFVTHQLRTPLAGIKWMLELASGGLPAGDEAASYVADAREAAERLIGLVNDLLDVSRLESGKVTPSLTDVDLAAMTREIVAELAGVVQDKGHQVTVEQADAVRTVRADRQLLRQVVLNLLSNALKYTQANGRIRIAMDTDAAGVVWSVRDSGIGIPKEAQRRLFEKFFRADNVRVVETEGTGLGLYLVKLIIERHGGRIWCESEEGQGSTFAFTLPP